MLKLILIFIFSLPAHAAVEDQVEKILKKMTLAEKIGQMTQVEKEAISKRKDDITRLFIGSILSGGGQPPVPNTKKAWADMTDEFQSYALATRLKIPLIYGVDAIHGHNNLKDAVIFPHAIGLGAARDPALVEAIAQATAVETAATGIRWNFAPAVSLPQDLRWGRVFEAFGENPNLVAELSAAYVTGLQGGSLLNGNQRSPIVLATAKHFIADGAAEFGTGLRGLVDRGDARIDENVLRRVHLQPYLATLATGVESIMVSYSSWNGVKMHASNYLLSGLLKGELNFQGFLISDWKALDELGPDERKNIKTAILAGLDMVMVPTSYDTFITHLTSLVESEEIPLARIDDAVRRILRVKILLGLFQKPFAERHLLSEVGSEKHRRLARTAVTKSQVLLKNVNNTLPLSKNKKQIFLVAGEGAENIGLQCGGWTIEWQGASGAITSGVTILEGIKRTVSRETNIIYSKDGDYQGKVDTAIVVVAEKPYAEFNGDTVIPQINALEQVLVNRVRTIADKLVLVVLSGRPLIMTPQIERADAVVAAFLPGSEAGSGLADTLFGDAPFTGRLPFAWPRNDTALAKANRNGENVLYPAGFSVSKK